MLEEATQAYGHIRDTGPECAYPPQKGGSRKFYPCYHPAGQALPEPLLSESQSGPPPFPSGPCELLALGSSHLTPQTYILPSPGQLPGPWAFSATQGWVKYCHSVHFCSVVPSFFLAGPGSSQEPCTAVRVEKLGQRLQNNNHWKRGRDGTRSLPSEQPNP